MNGQHPKIKYTIEKEKDKKIAFLDTLLQKTEDGLKISVYHKATYTGLLMSFLSFTSFVYKTGLVKCLVDRIYKINNSKEGLEADIKEMSHTLQKNHFPSRMIDKITKKYLQSKSQNKQQVENKEEEQVSYFKLPYLGKHSKQASDRVRKLSGELCKNTKIKIVFTSCKISSFFSAKDYPT